MRQAILALPVLLALSAFMPAPLTPNGKVVELRNASDEVTGYGFLAHAKQYWMVPPENQRPPNAGESHELTPLGVMSYSAFLDLVDDEWSTGDRWIEADVTTYPTYESIPSALRPGFFPNSTAPRDGIQIDDGSVGVFLNAVQVAVAHRNSSGTTYDEYWVLDEDYSYNESMLWTAGALDTRFDSWQTGFRASLVSCTESSTHP